MFKKFSALLASAAFCLTSAFALTPDTLSMYEKAANVTLLDVSKSNKGAVYIMIGLLAAFVIVAYILDRRSRKRLIQAAENMERQRRERNNNNNDNT